MSPRGDSASSACGHDDMSNCNKNVVGGSKSLQRHERRSEARNAVLQH